MPVLRAVTLALFASLTVSAAAAQQADTPYRIQNRFRPATFLHTEQGSVAVGPIQPGWWSADWIIEPVAGSAPWVRLRNRFRPLDYIHNQNGRVQSGPLGDRGWWSAQWAIEPVAGTPFVRLRNRWKPTEFLHTERGALESGTIDLGWWSAMWTVRARDEAVASAPPTPAAPPAQVVPSGPAVAPNDECSPRDGRCSDMSDPTIWRLITPRGPIAASAIPADAEAVGSEPAGGGARRDLYVCVAYFPIANQSWPQRFIGKTGPGFEGCNVPVGGREVVVTQPFLILLRPLPGPLGDLPAAVWTAASDGVVPGRGLQTFGGADLCRAAYRGGTHPGRVIAGRGCGIGYGNVEVVLPAYQVLVRLAIKGGGS